MEAEIQQFISGILAQAARDDFLDLLKSPRAGCLYHVADRNGVAVTAVPTTSLTEEELIKLLRYRLAQYVAIGFIDPKTVYEAGVTHEPLSYVTPSDVHFIAARASNGEILCYACMRALENPPPGATLKTVDRPLFPVETSFGWGVFNRLQMLPDIPIWKIRELKRLVKNQQVPKLDELATRAPVEISLAVVRTLTGRLRMEVDAFIGDLEEMVAKRHLEYFHMPSVVIHGAIPDVKERDYLGMHILTSECFPFAVLVSDLSETVRTRVVDIEKALALPGQQCVVELLRLKHVEFHTKSSLEPTAGLDRLVDSKMQQKGVTMRTRHKLIDMGKQLRQFGIFSGLSVAEACVLRARMTNVEMDAGQHIVRQGEEADGLFVIEEGEAVVQSTNAGGETVELGHLKAGDYFGEIGLLTGGERIADVIALGPIKLLNLSRSTYEEFLQERVDFQQQVALTAAKRAAENLQKTRPPGRRDTRV